MIPNDPIMLLSYINTQLRDNYASLDDLCDSLDVCEEDVLRKLDGVGYIYKQDDNKFVKK